MAENTREIVLEILLEIEKKGSFDHLLIRQVLEKFDYLSTQEKAFIKRAAEGTIERKITLDYVLDTYSSVPVRKMKPFMRCLMRLSVYQLLYMDGIPDHAVCSEAQKLAQRHKFGSLKGFVNGVLRRISRERDSLTWPDEKADWKRAVSIRESIPLWILERWEREMSREQVMALAAAFGKVRPTCVRVKESLTKDERNGLLQAWDAAGISYSQHPYYEQAYCLTGLSGAQMLPGFVEGQLTIQDISSMLVTLCADVKPGMTLVDVCAAPGGKILHGAERLRGSGKALGFDVSERKVELMEEAAERMKLDVFSARVQDASVFHPELENTADVLYLDVPCSGLGIMGRKRDIKYRLQENSLQELMALQKKIVENSWRYVKVGGVLLYSTCTIHRGENGDMADWICRELPFEASSLDAYLPGVLHSEETGRGRLQLLPGVHDSDGFFLSRFVRTR